jgi:protein-L-isoaspartate(D-aspartate) O-methyltransferase
MDFVSARQNMVDSQVRTNDVTDVPLQQAMRAVRRERFCAPARAFVAYAEVETEIAPGRVLMLPRDVSKLLQGLKPRAGERALAIAAPYAAAVLARMGVSVTAQEADARAAAVLQPALAEEGVSLHVAPLREPVGQGYDVIVCEGAAEEIPQSWFDALAMGGRLGAVQRDGPVGRAKLWVKADAGVSSRAIFDANPPTLGGLEKAPGFVF